MSDHQISLAEACQLISSIGWAGAESHPAQDHILLQDGRVIVLDEGGYDHDRSWNLRDPAEDRGTGRA